MPSSLHASCVPASISWASPSSSLSSSAPHSRASLEHWSPFPPLPSSPFCSRNTPSRKILHNHDGAFTDGPIQTPAKLVNLNVKPMPNEPHKSPLKIIIATVIILATVAYLAFT